MSIEELRPIESLKAAPEMWDEILRHHPEVRYLFLATYMARPHGISERKSNEVLLVESLDILSRPWFPKRESIALSAISSLVGLEPNEKYDMAETKVAWVNIPGSDDCPYRFVPQSFVLLDLEVSPSGENSKRIVLSLSSLEDDWYLLDSGGSYHLIVDKLVEPQDLPKYWGKIINLFATYTNASNLAGMVGIGNGLIDNFNNRRWLRALARDLKEDFGHIDDSDFSKDVFLIDLRHLAISINELVDFLETEEVKKGFCFLRTSNHPKYPSPPLLIAQKSGKKVIIYKSENSSFQDRERQLKLTI